MPLDKHTALQKIAAEIVDNKICPSLAESANSLVMGSGDVDAEILFIGEAPGKKEDQTGLPFVGAAGKFLDQMLAEAGLSREDVFITNIVKYRPPNNRDPSVEEKQAFWPYLLRQIEIIQPKVIVTLGRHSGTYLLPDLVISRDHGVGRQARLGETELTVVPLYHPAAALYNGGLRQTLIEDFKRMVEAYRSDG